MLKFDTSKLKIAFSAINYDYIEEIMSSDNFLDVFLKLNTVNEILTIYRQLTRQSSLERHPCRVFYDKVEF